MPIPADLAWNSVAKPKGKRVSGARGGTPAAAEGPCLPRHHLGHFAGIGYDLFCHFPPFPTPSGLSNVRSRWKADFWGGFLVFFFHYGFPQMYPKGEGTGSPSSSLGCSHADGSLMSDSLPWLGGSTALIGVSALLIAGSGLACVIKMLPLPCREPTAGHGHAGSLHPIGTSVRPTRRRSGT